MLGSGNFLRWPGSGGQPEPGCELGGVEPDTFRLYLEVSVKITTFEENELLLRNVQSTIE